MNNIITQIWQGSLSPGRTLGANNRELKQLEGYMEAHLKRLEPQLSEEAQKSFAGYNDCLNEYLVISTEQAFHDGFCLGAKIVAEALVRADTVCPVP